ncbi:8-oxoguanine deaminase [Intestinimonas timonensis]|uniref:8-oxoguanine deaminase n=1 Tax=Intestinimonas timonensis TaxID=1689270 RepID=UPI0010316B2B|nr:8-oxoguanine deaminase [Intestinimonas timonensis]
MSKDLLVKNIRWLVTCNDAGEVLEHASMLVRNGVIVSIDQPGDVKADEVIDASGMILYPGMINAHHHLYQIFSRNLPQVQRMELFPWLKTLYEIWKNLEEESIYYSSMSGMGELLKTGCTTILDHHYVFPQGKSDRFLDVQFAAADELGVRFHATRGSMDLSVKDGGLPPDSVVQTIDKIMYDSEAAVKKFHDPSRYSMHQVALAPCSPFSVSEELLRQTAILARQLGVRMHTHLAETKDEEAYLLERLGMRPLEYMENLGWIGSDVWYAHGIHFTDEELQRMAKTKTGVAHCPISNMKLSSGIAQIPRMLELGVPVGLAVDGSASNDGSNLLEELRVGYLLHRLNNSATAPTGADMLRIATRGSASLLGRSDLGYIAPGMAADFFLIDSNRLELTGTLQDVAAIPATVGFKGSVDYTVVNGRIVVKEGHLVNVDEDKLVEQANLSVVRYLNQN